MSAKLVIFDLDGTLVDSVPDIAEALRRALAELGLPEPSEAETRRWVGNGARVLVERALAWAGAEGMLAGTAHAAFLRHYAQCLDARSRLYPGVAECLAGLKAAGRTLAICTNKPTAFVAPLLASLGIAGYFADCLGGDALPARKPDPLPLLVLAERFGLPPGECLMVGDSLNDLEAAEAAGMPAVAVSYGYHQGADLAARRPIALLDSLAGLPRLLAPAAA